MDAVATKVDMRALQPVVEDAYKAFRRHARPAFPLDVCLNCCMDAGLERDMREKPLRQLTSRHFYEYNTSAKSMEQPAAEILFLEFWPARDYQANMGCLPFNTMVDAVFDHLTQ